MNIEPQFKDGLRVTDADTMDIVEMVLVGRLNKQIVSLVNQAGGSAVGICGKDGNLVTARQVEQKEIGFVGEITAVNTGIIEALISRRHIPVVSSVAADETGQSYNINADTFAGEIAAALGAEKLVLMTDTPGLMKDFHDPESLIRQLDIREARRLVESGVVSGGMIPKLTCCIRSLAQGVRNAHIIDGRMPHSLLLETFTDTGIGTMLTA
jgi:acetylglutamate kinase